MLSISPPWLMVTKPQHLINNYKIRFWDRKITFLHWVSNFLYNWSLQSVHLPVRLSIHSSACHSYWSTGYKIYICCSHCQAMNLNLQIDYGWTLAMFALFVQLLLRWGVGGAVRFLVVGTISQGERPPRGQLWMQQCLTSLKYWPI